MEYDRGVVARRCRSERALVSDRDRVDDLRPRSVSQSPSLTRRSRSAPTHLRMTDDLSGRRSTVHHERMPEPTYDARISAHTHAAHGAQYALFLPVTDGDDAFAFAIPR